MGQNLHPHVGDGRTEFAVFHTGTTTTQFELTPGDQVVRVEGQIHHILTTDGIQMNPKEYYYSRIKH